MIKRILLITIALISYNITMAQCDPISLKDESLQLLEDGYTYIKSFPLSETKLNDKGEVEYSFVFSKGTKYMFTLVDENGKTEKINIELYDPNKSMIAKSKKSDYLNYSCNDTGVHYMTFSFKKNVDNCGLVLLSFKR